MAATNDETQPQDAGGQDQRHDEGYKYILSKASNFLHFLKKYFHAPWMADISVDDIEPVNKSYITKEYRRVDSDLIYKLKRGDADIYFYVLLELQSKVDHTMVFRLLRYMVELLNDIFKNADKNVRRRKDYRLPAIVPIVLYDGDSRWTAVKSFKEYTKDYGMFGNNIIDFEYLLLDLNRTDDSRILPVNKLLDAAFSLAKMRFEKKLSPEEVNIWWAEQAPHLSKEDILELADWMSLALRVSPEIKETLKDTLMKGDGVAMKTGFELWADEYRGSLVLEGERKGKREGQREGKREKALEIADKLMAKGMSISEVADATGLTVDEILQR
jgi:predicted transposase/invertase (TIGR01784 family)